MTRFTARHGDAACANAAYADFCKDMPRRLPALIHRGAARFSSVIPFPESRFSFPLLPFPPFLSSHARTPHPSVHAPASGRSNWPRRLARVYFISALALANMPSGRPRSGRSFAFSSSVLRPAAVLVASCCTNHGGYTTRVAPSRNGASSAFPLSTSLSHVGVPGS